MTGKKTLRKKEKMLVIRIFSFSHNVFKSFLFHGREKLGLRGKELIETIKIQTCPNW